MKPSEYLVEWYQSAGDGYKDGVPDEEVVVFNKILALLEAVEKSCPEYLQGELMDLRRMKAKYEDEILSEAIPNLHAALALQELSC